MSRLRQFGVVVVGITALFAMATACDRTPTDDPTAKVTLLYAVWDKNQVPVMQQLATIFSQSHPNITVSVQLTPWDSYWTKLKSAVMGGRRISARLTPMIAIFIVMRGNLSKE